MATSIPSNAPKRRRRFCLAPAILIGTGAVALITATPTAAKAAMSATSPAGCSDTDHAFQVSLTNGPTTTTYNLCLTNKAITNYTAASSSGLADTPWFSSNTGLANKLATAMENQASTLYQFTLPNNKSVGTNNGIGTSGSPAWAGPLFLTKQSGSCDSNATACNNQAVSYGLSFASSQVIVSSSTNNSWKPNGTLFTYVGFAGIGGTAPDPAPGPLPLLGAGAAFGWSRRLRRRTRTNAEAAADSLRPLPVASSTEACL